MILTLIVALVFGFKFVLTPTSSSLPTDIKSRPTTITTKTTTTSASKTTETTAPTKTTSEPKQTNGSSTTDDANYNPIPTP